MENDRRKASHRGKGVRLTVTLLVLLALGFYFGFILAVANGVGH